MTEVGGCSVRDRGWICRDRDSWWLFDLYISRYDDTSAGLTMFSPNCCPPSRMIMDQ